MQETEKSKPIARTWTEVYDMLCTMALNDCSMEIRKPEKVSTVDTISGWSTGNPTATGDYVVVYGLPKTEDSKTSSEKIMWWDGFDFVNKKSRVAQLEGMNIYRWIRLPEV